MRIIKLGRVPEEKEARITCRNCGCIFVAKQEEGKTTYCQKDGDFVTFTCPQPECGCNVTVDREMFT